MLNKIIKLFKIILMGAIIFTISPVFSYAQYYYNNYNYSPLAVTTTKLGRSYFIAPFQFPRLSVPAAVSASS